MNSKRLTEVLATKLDRRRLLTRTGVGLVAGVAATFGLRQGASGACGEYGCCCLAYDPTPGCVSDCPSYGGVAYYWSCYAQSLHYRCYECIVSGSDCNGQSVCSAYYQV